MIHSKAIIEYAGEAKIYRKMWKWINHVRKCLFIGLFIHICIAKHTLTVKMGGCDEIWLVGKSVHRGLRIIDRDDITATIATIVTVISSYIF